MLKTKEFLMILVLLLSCGLVNAEVLFVDDFEGDNLGEEPSKWEHIAFAGGDSPITVEESPDDPNNKVVMTVGIGLYIPIADGRDNWSDYIWEFDWMWENDDFVGTVYRVEGAEAHFHGSRRQGASEIHIYTRNAGAWANVATGVYPNENNVWYSHRLVMMGDKHEIYLKERDDDTPFEDLDPVVEANDDTFKNGPVGMMGITAGVSYFDNMVLVENLQDIDKLKSVDRRGKLAITWGEIRNQ
ncbi:hypothetical protein GF312_05590 [Candidatus Poribacteria bacterium]|nr:hypothetical protein [Candidatus Poribacteria bacterium]